MQQPLLAALIVGAALFTPARAASPPPLCQVEAHHSPALVGRLLVVMVRPGCPDSGVAYVRLRSQLGGSLPDTPPAVWTIKRGWALHVTALEFWWLEWCNRSGTCWHVPESK